MNARSASMTTTEQLNAEALRELVAKRSPTHTDSAACPCRTCFYRDDRPRYWTSGDVADGEVAS